MEITIITIFPNLFDGVFNFGIIDQAKKAGVLQINIINLRDFAEGNYKQVDNRPFGGGVGMVLMPEPLSRAIESVKKENSKIIFLTPSGKKLEQEGVEGFSKYEHLILICGRYEGIDQRIIDKYVHFEISVGDYVLSGGEIPAMIVVDSISRLLPGAIKNDEFNNSESFSNPTNRDQLDFPQYTRPAEFLGLKVPDVLQSGNHKEIEKWREDNRKITPSNQTPNKLTS